MTKKIKIFLGLGVVLIFVAGIIWGVFFVIKNQNQNQDTRSKAATFDNYLVNSALGCRWLWPSNVYPKHISPKNNLTGDQGVNLTPTFKWDYRSCEAQSVMCSSFPGLTISAMVGIYTCPAGLDPDLESVYSCPIASSHHLKEWGNLGDSGCVKIGGATTTQQDIPITEMSWYAPDGTPRFGSLTLSPNTDYWWYPWTGAGGGGPHTRTELWHFRTGSTGPVCNSLTMNPASTVITTAGETRTFTASGTGTGNLTYNWTVTGGTLSSNTGQTVTWTAPATPSSGQTWTIKATAKDELGQVAANSNCTTTFSYSPAPVAVCKKVEADKDLSTIKIGDVVTFSGYGNIVGNDILDKVNFRILKDGLEIDNKTVAAILDPLSAGTTKVYKGTTQYTVISSGSYSVIIKVHQKNADRWLE